VRYGQHRPVEFVVEADAHNVAREPDILSKNYGRRERGNGVVEDGVFAKIDMQIFGLYRPVGADHRLDAAAERPAGHGLGAVANRAVEEGVALMAVQRAHGEAAGHVRQVPVDGPADAAAECAECTEV
jgi:hypothetical protein